MMYLYIMINYKKEHRIELSLLLIFFPSATLNSLIVFC